MNPITPEQAVDLIEEFFRRCSARFGDSSLITLSENDIDWLRLQADAWPYDEPNLFRQLADQSEDEPSQTSVRIADKPTLLELAFQLTREQIDKLELACPHCGRRGGGSFS